MGSRFCCVMINKNAVDHENEIVSNDPNETFNKLKKGLIAKENGVMISKGMTIVRGEFDDFNSEKDMKVNQKNKNLAEVSSEKAKKKKKKKKHEPNSEDKRIEKKLNLDNLKEDQLKDRYQRTSKMDKFYLTIGIVNPESNYSDTFHIEIFLSNSGDVEDKYVSIGRTDEQNRNSKIDFAEHYQIDYNFEMSQYIKIVYYNSDNWRTEIVICLALIITENAPQFNVPVNIYKSEKIIVTRSMLKCTTNQSHNYARIKFERDTYGKKDEEGAFFLEFNYISMAFIAKRLHYKLFRLLQKQITGERQELFCSNERYGKSPIYFNPAYLLEDFIQNNLPLYFEFYDKRGIIGEYLLEKKGFDSLKSNSLIVSLYDNKNINFGDFKITYASMPNNHFLDYLNHGLDLNLILGIDYTSSNKDPLNPTSLHTLVGEGKNVYENAIRSCGGNLAYYDKTQAFPVFGFGGIPKGKNILSHCFNINGLPNPNIKGGLEEVIKTYKKSLKSVKLLGPTRFSELIQNVLDQTKKYRKTIEQEEALALSKLHNHGLKNNKSLSQIKYEMKEMQNRSSGTQNTSGLKPLYPTVNLESKKDKLQTSHYSKSRKPFASPSLKNLKGGYLPREENEAPIRPTVSISKKAIRNAIFKEHEEFEPEEVKNFIIPKSERNYAILLILTDGKIDDMQETKNILVQASNYPISVIIIGVGDANFGNMIELRMLSYLNFRK